MCSFIILTFLLHQPGSLPSASCVAGVQFGLQLLMPLASMIFLINPHWVSVMVFSTGSFTNFIPRNFLHESFQSLPLQFFHLAYRLLLHCLCNSHVINKCHNQHVFLIEEALVNMTLYETILSRLQLVGQSKESHIFWPCKQVNSFKEKWSTKTQPNIWDNISS